MRRSIIVQDSPLAWRIMFGDFDVSWSKTNDQRGLCAIIQDGVASFVATATEVTQRVLSLEHDEMLAARLEMQLGKGFQVKEFMLEVDAIRVIKDSGGW
ncbi:hypothetical protein ACH5RR_012652 [Cinchona calisaya]|uniref:RNase H type-1 domain-containing protein n=1 Tax=Cinchona calisaya TaxID=153742 RepID=A0ABD3AAR1_9GENT